MNQILRNTINNEYIIPRKKINDLHPKPVTKYTWFQQIYKSLRKLIDKTSKLLICEPGKRLNTK